MVKILYLPHGLQENNVFYFGVRYKVVDPNHEENQIIHTVAEVTWLPKLTSYEKTSILMKNKHKLFRISSDSLAFFPETTLPQ